MPKSSDFVQVSTKLGDRIAIGDALLTPQSQALIIRWRPNAAFVYNRPLAVFVDQNGTTQRMPVVDVTRLIQVGLLAISLVFLLAGFNRRVSRRKSSVRSNQ